MLSCATLGTGGYTYTSVILRTLTTALCAFAGFAERSPHDLAGMALILASRWVET